MAAFALIGWLFIQPCLHQLILHVSEATYSQAYSFPPVHAMNTASMEPIASSISGQSSNLTSPWTPTSANLHGLEKMQVLHFSNEFPHDDLNDLFRRLHVHSTRKTHHVLSNFIAEATHALRDEVRQLPTNLRDLVPPFESILDISDDSTLKQGPLGAAVEGMLLCVVHIASLIGLVYSLLVPVASHPQDHLTLSTDISRMTQKKNMTFQNWKLVWLD